MIRTALALCACTLALLACTLALAASALAQRRPTSGERRAIIAALHRHHISQPVLRVRISTVVAGWAVAKLRDGNDAILRRRAGRWRVAQVGGLGIGCRIPYTVRRDFKLIC